MLHGRHGAYDLAVPAGTYRLQFEGPGDAWRGEFWNDVLDFSLATSVLVGEEAVPADYDVVLAPAGPHPERLCRAARCPNPARHDAFGLR